MPAPVGSADRLSCPTCGTIASSSVGAATPSYVYAIGKIEPRFPKRSAVKEFAQAIGKEETTGLTDRQAFQKVLSQRHSRYLTRLLCWVNDDPRPRNLHLSASRHRGPGS